MIEVVTKTYKFEELSEEAKKKALEDNNGINVQDNRWYEGEVEYHKEQLEEAGWNDIEISFSGFWSQGDGASFTGKVIDLPLLNRTWGLGLKESQAKVIQEWANISMSRNSLHYSHENTVNCLVEYYTGKSTPRIDKLINQLEEKIQEMARDTMGTIYKNLETCYDGDTSDEAVTEALIDCNFDFTEDGTHFIGY